MNPGELSVDYVRIVTMDPSGQKDQFYFSRVGYKWPDGDLGWNWFWSSSVVPDMSDYAYFLSGPLGDITWEKNRDYRHVLNTNFAVRCFPAVRP